MDTTPKVPTRLATPLFVRVVVATFAYFVALGALLPTLPLYVRGPLGRGDAAVGLTIAVFAFAAVFLRPLAGRIGDSRGRRLLMVGGAAALAATIASYSLAGSLPVLLVLRMLSGVGEASFFVGAAAVAQDLAPDHRRGEAMSYFSLGLYGGLAAGPLLGELVLERGGFDPVWLASAGFAALAAIICIWVTDTRPALPPAGSRSFINRAGILPGTILLTNVWGMVAFTAFISLYARELGMPGSASAFLLFSGIVLAIRSIGARIPDVLGFHRAAASSLVTTGLGLFVMAVVATPIGLYVGTAILAVGQGLAFPALMSMAISSASPAERASVVGTVGMFFDTAIGVGALSSGVIAAALGYRGAFAVAAGGAVLGLGLLFGDRRRRRRRAG